MNDANITVSAGRGCGWLAILGLFSGAFDICIIVGVVWLIVKVLQWIGVLG
jgi:hypothetical protein